jgi:hypothetical protein
MSDEPTNDEQRTGTASATGNDEFLAAVALALGSRKHRTHWAQPGLTVRGIQRALADDYPNLRPGQVSRALNALNAVEKVGKNGEDTGVTFWALPPSIKIGTCSHCGTENVEVRMWRQPGASQTAICDECAG